jgi:signal transduction histidine kinase
MTVTIRILGGPFLLSIPPAPWIAHHSRSLAVVRCFSVRRGRTRQFVADAAHELRTPLAGVQTAAEASVTAGLPESERQRLHLLLVREAQRAGRLVEDLLALARIDAGQQPGTHRS